MHAGAEGGVFAEQRASQTATRATYTEVFDHTGMDRSDRVVKTNLRGKFRADARVLALGRRGNELARRLQ